MAPNVPQKRATRRVVQRLAFSMRFPFFKMQGAGNDFVVLDALSHSFTPEFDFTRAALALCDRHFGAGGDGLLTLETPTPDAKDAAVRMRMWNPDGSEDMCGNGLRCVAALAARQKHVSQRHFAIETLAGIREIEVLQANFIRAGMGMPRFEPSAIPMQNLEGRTDAVDYALEAGGRVFSGAVSLSTGSAHTVLWLENPLLDAEFFRFSPLLENHPWFAERTSVMWARPCGANELELRIWERGVGETLACGTGACAAAVAAIVTGRCEGKIEVASRGGVLGVEWPEQQMIWLSGPAELVFEGVWYGEF